MRTLVGSAGPDCHGLPYNLEGCDSMLRIPTALVLAIAALPALAGIPAEQEDCLGCHTDASMTYDLPSGEKLPLARRPGRVREVGARRQPPLHGLSLREDERPRHRRAQVQEPPRGDARPLRAVQGLPLRELHEDARRRALRRDGEGERQGGALRRLPRRARHLAPRPAAHAHLEDVLRLPREGGRGLREERPRPRRRVEQRRPGLHGLPPRARHDRPARRRARDAHPGDLRRAATPTRSS